MKKVIALFCVLIAMSLTGCATMIRGTSEKLNITSTPEGATARLSNGDGCTTPCQMKLKRKQSVLITYTKRGCRAAQLSVYPTLSGSGILLGGLIDYGDGAVYNLVPNPAHVLLICNRHSYKA